MKLTMNTQHYIKPTS